MSMRTFAKADCRRCAGKRDRVYPQRRHRGEKAALFSKVRSGDVRVLLGSTAKMGAGTNIQSRLVAVHHLDVGWKPSDMTQRNGRIIRQGNMNKEVKVFNYVTEGTFDSYLFQTLENKQRFISQIMTSNPRCAPARMWTSKRYLTPKSRHCVPEIRSSRRRWTWTCRWRS